MMDQALLYGRWAAGPIALIVAVAATAHVLLYKRDTRAAIGWVGVIWLTPFLGSLLYLLLGINRIRRRARRLRRKHRPLDQAEAPPQDADDLFARYSATDKLHFAPLVHLVGAVTGQELLSGNRVRPLRNGDEAYPAMIGAIHEAKQSVALATYIFANDRTGTQFVEALGKAVARGVEVRVLIDDIGVHYSWPTIRGQLRKASVTFAEFLPSLVPWHVRFANLRSHRKLLVVDGRVGFTGGMNISAPNELATPARHPIQDLHFKIEGPAVAQVQEVFADDWAFTTGERLTDDIWFPDLESRGKVLARGVASGPDATFEHLKLICQGALACARERVRIVTPYFLPDAGLVAALTTAALRGVEVDILLPAKNNHPLVGWAATAQLPDVLEHGCRVWATPPPFDHSKLIIIDGTWTFVGSANLDPRSLDLNFEFNVECYDRDLAEELETIVREKLGKARPITLATVNGRSLPVKLRDGVARLLTPYL